MLTHLQPSPAAPARVVILGARGFLSLHLHDLLKAQGTTVVAVSSRDIDLTGPDSASRLAALFRPDDAVVMMSTLTPEKGRDFATLMSNLRMAENVCRSLEQARCAHFVYVSSDAVYDAHQTPLDEDSTREPTELYSLMHTAREMMLGSVLERTKTPYAILRPTNVYGPGDTHNNYGPNRFVRSALRESRIVLFGQGEERRSQVFIADAVRLIGLVLLRRSTGTLNLATKPAVSFREVADAVIRLCPHPVKVEFAPRTVPVVHRPYKPTQIARFIYNLGRPIGPIVHRPFAISAILDAFPSFTFTPITRGLARFVEAEQQAAASGRDRAPGGTTP